MKITKWLVSGDTHGDFSRFYSINSLVPKDETWGVIILGDAGLNFWFKSPIPEVANRDKVNKKRVTKKCNKLNFFLVRGNHEARPQDVPGLEKIFCYEVHDYVYHENEYPNIFYLLDGHEYLFGEYTALVLGGAYSIDKYYRLQSEANGGYGGWFENEQLGPTERKAILEMFSGEHYDLLLAHTCPWEWRPIDLFLSYVDQSKVDESMELWLSEVIQKIGYTVFLCGHYHDDRILAPQAEMLSTKVKNLDDIMEYWKFPC